MTGRKCRVKCRVSCRVFGPTRHAKTESRQQVARQMSGLSGFLNRREPQRIWASYQNIENPAEKGLNDAA